MKGTSPIAMLSFVWSDPLPIYSGRGGTESFVIGQIRELNRRGIATRILTYGLGNNDGRIFFPDITFKSLASLDELTQLDDTIIFLNIPRVVKTKKPSFVFFHFPAVETHGIRNDYKRGVAHKTVVTNSRFLRSYWADFLNIKETKIHVVYPFAEPVFAKVKRSKSSRLVRRVLFAGRLSPEKGIYLLLEALHQPFATYKPLVDHSITFTITTAGDQTIHGKIIESFLRHHPWVNLVEARHSPEAMAQLYAEHDIVVMPSNNKYWFEGFGMNSIEAQHAGCRVVASNSGGLPETNCGELILFEAGNSMAFAKTIIKAAKLGPLAASERKEAIKHYTLAESVDSLLRVVAPSLDLLATPTAS